MTTTASRVTDERISDELLASMINEAVNEDWEDFALALRELQSLRSLSSDSVSDGSKGVKIKPLTWQPIGPAGSDVEAETPIGTYTMSFEALSAGGGVNLWMAGSDVDTFSVHDKRKDAEAAAQADYQRRILSTIAPFEVGDRVTFVGVGECVVQQCFDAAGGWRVIAKGPSCAANPKGLYDFPASNVTALDSHQEPRS